MKPLIFILFFCLTAIQNNFSQTEFVLDPSQSMLMTGKGAGQDGAINPYYGEDCYAIIKNLGKKEFTIRIQQKGKIIEIIPISKKETKKIELLKGYELYLDSNETSKIKAKVTFEKMESGDN